MPRLDEPGVHRADRNFVHAGALDLNERIGSAVVAHRRHGTGVAAKGIPALGPVLVAHERAHERVAGRDDAEGVVELSLEPARDEGEIAQRRHHRARGVESDHEFVSHVRRSHGEDVHDA